MTIVFGTRGSALALSQTEHTIRRFRELNSDVQTEITVITTTGDRLADAPLAAIGGQGAFTREIEQALLAGDIDAAVHSLKDLPVHQPDGLHLCAIAERATPADALVSEAGHTLESLPEGARVGTSSLRRKMQLLLTRPDLRIMELRGNVPTRIARVREGRIDAAIIALAGMRRLNLGNETCFREIPLSQMLPAPGQGALAVEIRAGDSGIARRMERLHDARAAAEVRCERAILEGFGGGCRSPLGAHAICVDGRLRIEALAGNPDTGEAKRIQESGSVEDAESLGREIGLRLSKGLNLC